MVAPSGTSGAATSGAAPAGSARRLCAPATRGRRSPALLSSTASTPKNASAARGQLRHLRLRRSRSSGNRC
eukprot:6085966-Prymnesium_polylepis.1